MIATEEVAAPAKAQAKPVVNDFTFQAATINGSGSQSSNLVITRALFMMGIPVAPKNVFPSNIEGLPTCAAGGLLIAAGQSVSPPAPAGAVPSARQLAWQDLEFYGFVHFTVNTFTDKEWGYGDEPETDFNPTALDARQWVRVAARRRDEGTDPHGEAPRRVRPLAQPPAPTHSVEAQSLARRPRRRRRRARAGVPGGWPEVRRLSVAVGS